MTQKKEYFENNCSSLLKGIFNTSVFLLNFTKRCTLWFFCLFFTDINECKLNISRCEQKCVNKQWSYACECENSYRLDPDGFSCTGKMWTEVCEQTWVLCVWMCEKSYRLDPDGFSCEQKCVSKQGSYVCECEKFNGSWWVLMHR